MTTPLPRAQVLTLCAGLLLLILWSLARSLPTPLLLDFGSFVASGRAAGEGLDPYGVYDLTFRVVLPGFTSFNPNLNPPVALPLFELLGLFDPHQAFRAWWGLSVAFYVAAVGLLAFRYSDRGFLLPLLFALSLAGFWDTLVLGQIYTPLVLAGTLGWLALDRGRPLLAGIAIGFVVAVKPNFLVWPGLLFLSGHLAAPVAAGVTAIVLTVLPLLRYDVSVYGQWVRLILNDEDRGIFLTNASLAGILGRAGLGSLALPAAVLLLAALALWAFRRRPTPLLASAVGIVGALAASPIAWVHYTLFLLPVFFAAPLNPWLLAAAVLLVVPVPALLTMLDAGPLVQASLGSAYGWAVLLCLPGLLALSGREAFQIRLRTKAQTNASAMPESTSTGL